MRTLPSRKLGKVFSWMLEHELVALPLEKALLEKMKL